MIADAEKAPAHDQLQILVLEDNAADAELTLRELRKQNIQFSAKRVANETGFLEALNDPSLDLILADHSLPSYDGLSALRSARRARPEVPFIVVSGTLGEENAIEALQLGATDYVLKQRLTRLVPAVKRAFREMRERQQRREAEKALRESELLRMAMLDSIPVGIWFMNGQGEIQFANSFDRLLWNGRATLPADRGSDYNAWHRDLVQRVLDEQWAVARCLRDKAPSSDEPREITCFDGKTRAILHSAVPLVGTTGEVLGAIAVNQDVTASRQAEVRIREQANLLDLTDDVITVRDLEGKILYWNKGAQRLLGWAADEVHGREIQTLLDPESVSRYQESLQQTLQHGSWRGELRLSTKAGRPVELQSRWTLVKDAEGKPQSILAVESDVTERKQIEAQFLRAQRLESVGQLAGGIAHDINNILSPITMAVALAREVCDDPQLHTLLDMIETSAKRGANILRQLLVFSRGSQGPRVPVSVKRLIDDLARMVYETFPKSITFQTKTEPGLWLVPGDETQLDQVLINLCVNARDAMPTGGTLTVTAENVTLRCRDLHALPGAKPGSYVRVRVSDTGTGMAPATLERIFDPFFTTKGPDKGTGLGLSTVLGIVKGHGGFIKPKSVPGHGSEFEVYLPSAMSPEPAAASPRSVARSRGRQQTILVIDDERVILDITRRVLEHAGYRVLTAENGAEAMTIYARHEEEIRVVMTDLLMPIMDGSSAILVLRRRKPDIKIVAFSGVESSKVTEAESLGVNAFLRKPIQADTLLATISEVLHSDTVGAAPPP